MKYPLIKDLLKSDGSDTGEYRLYKKDECSIGFKIEISPALNLINITPQLIRKDGAVAFEVWESRTVITSEAITLGSEGIAEKDAYETYSKQLLPAIGKDLLAILKGGQINATELIGEYIK